MLLQFILDHIHGAIDPKPRGVGRTVKVMDKIAFSFEKDGLDGEHLSRKRDLVGEYTSDCG